MKTTTFIIEASAFHAQACPPAESDRFVRVDVDGTFVAGICGMRTRCMDLNLLHVAAAVPPHYWGVTPPTGACTSWVEVTEHGLRFVLEAAQAHEHWSTVFIRHDDMRRLLEAAPPVVLIAGGADDSLRQRAAACGIDGADAAPRFEARHGVR